MSFGKLIAKQEALDGLIERFSPLLGVEMDALKRKHGLECIDELRAALKEIENTDRTLRIGVVGRMKAGKSSLLNALLFNGKSILPKAATPMTAALTTISWGEVVSAEIEFYSREDRNDIARKADRYWQELQSLITAKKSGLLQKIAAKRKQLASVDTGGTPVEEGEARSLELNARKAAELEMKKRVRLHAAHDQHQRMLSSPVRDEVLDEPRYIETDDLDALQSLLGDYVSAHGRYMPFCKSVHIKLPLESLRGLEVVDTPGFDDPVLSREMRTNDILARCDIVLIVSPSGRLLTEDDMSLMGRISQKEGVQEIFVVVSQTDMQLYGSERRATLQEALDVVQAKNSVRAEQVFRAYCETEPEARKVFAPILENSAHRVVCVSGMASSIAQRIENRQSLDADQKNALKMLRQFYPGEFVEVEDDALPNVMNFLSGIASVREILASADQRKKEILEQRKQKFAATKIAAIHDFVADVVDFGRNRVRDLEHTVSDELDSEIAHLAQMKEELSLEINHEFRDHRAALPRLMQDELRSVLKKAYRAAEAGVEESEGERSGTHTVEKSGGLASVARFLGIGGIETRHYTLITVSTARASKSVAEFVNNVADDMGHAFEALRENWRKSVHVSIARAYRQIVGDEGVDKRLVLRTIDDLVQGLELGEFNFDRGLPAGLRARGTLEGTEAETYLDRARDYIAELHGKIERAISACIRSVTLPEDVAGGFCRELEDRVRLLKEQIENKQESLSRFAQLERVFRELAE